MCLVVVLVRYVDADREDAPRTLASVNSLAVAFATHGCVSAQWCFSIDVLAGPQSQA